MESAVVDQSVVSESQLGEAKELALQIADILTETPAADTVVMDISKRSSFADYFVICSGENERQIRAIAGTVRDELSADDRLPRRMEGEAISGWMVVDYGDVVVHVFNVNQRDFYRLEELWSDAQTVLSIQ